MTLSSPSNPTQTPPRILIADDDPLGAELLEAYLSESESEVAPPATANRRSSPSHHGGPI